MARKVYLEATVRLIVNMDDGVEVSEVVNEMGSTFVSQTDGADIEDAEILGFKVTDSK